ncbi:MAG: hypothetical protein PHF63_00650 [Herbinix sp.]|nr:hypothetical protein [Herbinix sp.]
MAINFPNELVMGVDNFNQQQKLSPGESLAQNIINIFMMKPGTLPSLPHIGLDLGQYLYKFSEDIDGDHIKGLIEDQCADLVPYLSITDISIYVSEYKGVGLLIVRMTIEDENYMFGISKDKRSGNLLYNYQITNF